MGSKEKKTRQKKKSSIWGTLILILIMIIGIGIMAYPSVSDYWNSLHQSRAIASYVHAVEDMDNDQYELMWRTAREYNDAIAKNPLGWQLTDEQMEAYNQVLDVSGTGIMGYIEIPKINCMLPIYHGTDESILQIAIGHLPGSSLPVGGQTSHTLLSGHRGLPSAKLFTDLDKVVVGDLFYLRVLGDTLSYEVDSIHIVLPSDLSLLNMEQGRDYCTLITCTPYGINTHRLLVRGHRVELAEEEIPVKITTEAMRIPEKVVIPAVAIPILFILLVVALATSGRKKKPTVAEAEAAIGGESQAETQSDTNRENADMNNQADEADNQDSLHDTSQGSQGIKDSNPAKEQGGTYESSEEDKSVEDET